METSSIISLFLVLWWVVLFLVLPFGIQTEESPEKGHAKSAPKKARIPQKLFYTTLISAVITALLTYFVESGQLSIWDFVTRQTPNVAAS